jgi:predicted ATPase/DNA-binding XRE family transcriptional regulator
MWYARSARDPLEGQMALSAPMLFEDLLRQHRLRAGLTQEALAEKAGLSVHGVQKLERGGTCPHRETVRRLVNALQLSPADGDEFRAAAQRAPGIVSEPDEETLHVRSKLAQQLPAALTSFIGRGNEIDQIKRLLSNVRLLTLTGVGGCGKTRLALEVGRSVADLYPDGVWLVELAPLTDAALVPQAVASALGVRETRTQPLLVTVANSLKHRQLLLLLDNCEHLLDGCALLANTLLQACPQLQILATSREALGLTGEVSRRVPSLPVPSLDPLPSLEQLCELASVQLFVDRAGAVHPNFKVTRRNATAIAQICNRLDGIPLALELAAARVRGLSVEDLAGRLDQRFMLLTGGSRAALPRQQTLRAAIDWSYELLSPVERLLFARLSVFGGSWTLEAAEEVCAGDGIEPRSVVELTLRLIDKSLVVAEEDLDGSERYLLFDTLRQYGREQLLTTGHAQAIQDRHASYYQQLAQQIDLELTNPRPAAMHHLALEETNLRAGLDWLVARQEGQRALQVASVLCRLWEVRGYLSEGRRRLASVLAVRGASAPTSARAKVLDGAGVLALYQYDLAAARELFKESLALYRKHRQPRGVAWLLIHLGWLCHDSGRFKAARRFLREALQLCREIDDRPGIARSLTLLGMVSYMELDSATARTLHEQSLRLNREVGNRWGTAWALHVLGRDLLAQLELGDCDAEQVQAALEESVATWRELGERRHQAYANLDLGLLTIRRGETGLGRARLDEVLSTFLELDDVGDVVGALLHYADLFSVLHEPRRVLRICGAVSVLMKQLGQRLAPLQRTWIQRLVERAGTAVPADIASSEWATGETMSLNEAIAYVMDQSAAS